MSEVTIPTEEEIKTHFAKAKEIRCLASGNSTAVTAVKAYEYDAATASWTSKGGAVTYWKNGVYAEITKKRCEKCKNCNCK